MEVCDRLVSGVSPLHALLILHPDNYDHSSSSASIDFDSDSASRGNTQPESAYQLASAAASYTVGFYRIPIIGVNSRESAFSDKVSLTLGWVWVCLISLGMGGNWLRNASWTDTDRSGNVGLWPKTGSNRQPLAAIGSEYRPPGLFCGQ